MTERPDRPLVVKCAYDSTSRRIAFPSASKCRLTALRARASECFHLSALSFHFIYIDDDGEEFDIREEADLTEAILYFEGGGDDASIRSGAQGQLAKVQIKVEVVVEYDGPSLSDTSSLRSYSDEGLDGEGEGEEWGSSYYTESWGSSISGLSTRPSERDRRTYEESTAGPSRYMEGRDQVYNGVRQTQLDPDYGDDEVTEYAGARDEQAGLSMYDLSLADGPQQSTLRPLPPLTGPDSAPAPALLTHSELGSRWLKEQKDLAKRKLPRLVHGAPSTGHRGSRIWDSDSDSLGSDERVGDIALVKDERGRYYYSYETESLHSQPPTDPSLHHLPLRPDIPVPGLAIEPGGPPILAPDCSACGVRLEHMRYVCTTCGEGDLWKATDTDRTSRRDINGTSDRRDEQSRRESFATYALPSPSVSIASDESDLTEWAGGSTRTGRSPDRTGHEQYPRGRSASMSTRASQEAVSGRGGSSVGSSGSAEAAGRGFELCPSCIEVHGIDHAKAAESADRRLRADLAAEGVRRRSELRHSFREKFWGLEGWSDIEYSEVGTCTICRTHLLDNRYKCVSCTKFDLCQACYHRVGEIHPAHAFLSLPDRADEQTDADPSVLQPGEAVSQSQRHPGVFCHNCMQDIYGPRFHCAVCPSWDLCSQCESLPFADASGHTADHIMMKIPVPIPTAEVDAVSRRARSRWIEQDSGTVAAQSSAESLRARSPSPTEGTVYAGGAAASAIGNNSPAEQSRIVAGVNDDHRTSCNACGMGIKGTRYECVNCPTLPASYNLCSTCEVRSFRVHDPLHAFLRFDRPVPDIIRPVPSAEPLLPVILRDPAGHVPRTAAMNGATNAASVHRDPTAYLSHILHRETLCDVHCDQIRGVWLRCVHCVGGFDCCAEGEASAGHDPRHVFLVFKARVDMKVFRHLAGLDADRPRALINHQFYV